MVKWVPCSSVSTALLGPFLEAASLCVPPFLLEFALWESGRGPLMEPCHLSGLEGGTWPALGVGAAVCDVGVQGLPDQLHPSRDHGDGSQAPRDGRSPGGGDGG